jgi:UDP-N-acetylmuramoylalanine--D-glutamate ligase
MEEYVLAKLKIAGPETKLITVTDDAGIQKYVLPKISQPIGISLEEIPPELERFVSEENRALKGQHNLYNIAMALEVLKILNINDSRALDFIKNYAGLEHRIEFVREIDGVKYINDSKSTSPDATRVALEAFGDFKNIVLIAGGNDKKVSFEILHDPINQYVKFLVIFNHDINQKFIDIAEKFEIPYAVPNDLAECISIAKQNASAGEIVLFSPGAASLGKFNNFEHRGQVFKTVVKNLNL